MYQQISHSFKVNVYMWSLSSFSGIKPHGLVLCHSIPLLCLPFLQSGPDCEAHTSTPWIYYLHLHCNWCILSSALGSSAILYSTWYSKIPSRGNFGPVNICPKVLISVSFFVHSWGAPGRRGMAVSCLIQPALLPEGPSGIDRAYTSSLG